MFNFDKIDFQRFAVSAAGAVALSTTALLAAAGPVKAAELAAPLTVADWQTVMEQRIAAYQEPREVAQPSQLTSSEVAVRFTGDGDYAGAAIARSSGSRAVDRRALKVAGGLTYAALPAGYRGQPTTVRMTLYFGGPNAQADYDRLQGRHAHPVRLAMIGAGTQTAAR